jgi:1-pyrroline-5-carboxylate dehydrogenase
MREVPRGGFQNESTLDRLVKTRQEDEFHRRYDEAYAKALTELGKSYPNFVAGQERFSKEGEFLDICPYATTEILGRFQKGTREDVSKAVAVSLASQPRWEETKVRHRCYISTTAADIMSKRKYELAAWLTLENGKNRYEAMAEVDEAIDYLRYYPSVLMTNKGYVLETEGALPCDKAQSVLRPLGVMGVISPFNFPIAITTGMMTGALVTGNAVILKPASDTPMMGHLLFGILREAGIPTDVMHFITGPGETVGAELVQNKGIASIVFTGSKDVGHSIVRASVENGRRPPILEMGGKNPAIVTDRADLQLAAEGIGRGAFGYSGQKCSATSRAIVNRSVSDDFTKKLLEWLKGQKVGDPSKKETFIGPLINDAAVERFRKVIALASKDGKVLTGGHVLDGEPYAKGHFVEPTILVHLARNHELVLKELFVPVLIILTCSDLGDALGIANSVEYGLTAGIYSEDPKEVQEFFTRIQAGVTYANRRSGATTGALVGSQPFTGWKSSGVTGKGAGGPYYLLQFLQEQSRTMCR